MSRMKEGQNEQNKNRTTIVVTYGARPWSEQIPTDLLYLTDELMDLLYLTDELMDLLYLTDELTDLLYLTN